MKHHRASVFKLLITIFFTFTFEHRKLLDIIVQNIESNWLFKYQIIKCTRCICKSYEVILYCFEYPYFKTHVFTLPIWILQFDTLL